MAQPQAATGGCKILSVVWYNFLPARHDGQKAVADLYQALGKHVSLVCLCAEANVPTGSETYSVMNRLPNHRKQFFQPKVWQMIYKTAKREKATHILLEFPYHGLAALLCKLLLGTKIILRSHNIEFRRFRGLGRWWWPLLWVYEGTVMRCSDRIFVNTVDDFRRAGNAWAPWPLRFPQLDLLQCDPCEADGTSWELLGKIIAQKIEGT